MDKTIFAQALNKNAVIFDFDGVLAKIHVDWPALKSTLQKLIAEELGQCEELTPFDLRLNEILPTAPESLTIKANKCIEKFEMASFEKHSVFPEMLAFARELAAHGIKLFICSSNTNRVIVKILKEASVSACFEQIISREDVILRKPAPEGLRKIIRQNQFDLDQVLFIGDRYIDQQAGDAAGIQVRLVAPDESESILSYAKNN